MELHTKEAMARLVVNSIKDLHQMATKDTLDSKATSMLRQTITITISSLARTIIKDLPMVKEAFRTTRDTSDMEALWDQCRDRVACLCAATLEDQVKTANKDAEQAMALGEITGKDVITSISTDRVDLGFYCLSI